MARLNTDAWAQLGPYYDQARTLSEEEREAWIASLPEEIAEGLRALLLEHGSVEQAEFLASLSWDQNPRLANRQIGAYTLIHPLGSGGMGAVWLAERTDGRFDRKVAIKFILLALSGVEAALRFRQEGLILGRLSHPHIAKLMDAGVTAEGEPYLVLEYVEGEALDAHCDRADLSIEQRIRLFLDVLSAVAHAHQNLVVHRDLKPMNVLVHGKSEIKLLDFGIAKLLEVGENGEQTQTGCAFTPAYAAPEQLTGEAITTATDVYALGILCFLLLTGRHPYGDDLSHMHILDAAIRKEAPRMSDQVGVDVSAEAWVLAQHRATTPQKLRRTLRGDLDTIVAKALRKEPHQRYASVAALASDLRAYLDHEPIKARGASFPYYAARFIRRHRVGVAIITVAVSLIFAALAGLVTEMVAARRQRDLAMRQLSRSERVMNLNELLLSEVEPSGKPLKPNDLLEREEQIIEREHYSDAANHVDLLLSIGKQYSTQDENDQALHTLRQAYDLSRGINEPGVKGSASCELARGLINTAQLAEGEALFRQGLRELGDDRQLALDRVECLQAGTELAARRGDTSDEIVRAEAALREVRASPIQSDSGELESLTDLAAAYGETGRFHEAFQNFEQASTLLTRLGYDRTRTAVKLYNDWATILDYAGRPLEAAGRFQRAIAIRDGNTELPVLLHNYAKALRFLGRLEDARRNAERALTVAQQAGNPLVVIQSRLDLAGIAREQNRLAQSQQAFAQLETLMHQHLPPGHFAFSLLTSEESLLAQAQGDVKKALALADRAVAINEAAVGAGKQGAVFLPGLLTRRSGILLAAGRPAGAVADATRALHLLETQLEPDMLSAKTGLAHLSLGRSLAAQGQTREAQSQFDLAKRHLVDALGADAPDARTATQLADGTSLSQQP